MYEYSNYKIADIIDEWVHSERDRKILKDRLTKKLTYECLAEKYDISVSQVRRIMKSGINTICKHL